jgi:hypothetical protein
MFARRDYVFNDGAKLVHEAIYGALDREEKNSRVPGSSFKAFRPRRRVIYSG